MNLEYYMYEDITGDKGFYLKRRTPISSYVYYYRYSHSRDEWIEGNTEVIKNHILQSNIISKEKFLEERRKILMMKELRK